MFSLGYDMLVTKSSSCSYMHKDFQKENKNMQEGRGLVGEMVGCNHKKMRWGSNGEGVLSQHILRMYVNAKFTSNRGMVIIFQLFR